MVMQGQHTKVLKRADLIIEYRGTSLIRNRYPRRTTLGWSYRGISLIRNSGRLGPCSRTMPRALWQSQGGGQFLIHEVLL